MRAKWSNLLDLGLKTLSFIRQRPSDRKIGTCMAIMFLFSTLYYQFLSVWLITEIDGDIELLAKALEGFTTFSEVLIKMPPLLYHKILLTKMMHQMNLFWDPIDFPRVIREECEQIFKTGYYWINFYRYIVFLTCFLFYMQPLVHRELLIMCHEPDFPYAFEILLIGQYFYAAGVASYVTGFDGMYVAFCTHICVQMKLINNVVKNLDFNDPHFVLKLKTCVEHHRFMINFANNMISIYNISLLGQYFISIYLPCMELYILTHSYGNPERIILSMCYLCCLMFQMGLFCFPATEISDAMSALVNSIYDSKWYDGPVHLQKNVILVMMRAQSEFKVTAVGMAEINRAAYTVVLKASMSFYTVMKQLEEE